MTSAPLILALDISKTLTGVAEGRVGSVPLSYSIKGSDMDVPAAVRQLGRWLIEKIAVEKPDWIFFEAPISFGAFMGEYDPELGKVRMTSNPQTTAALLKMTGIVEFVAGMKDVAFREAKVQTVRKSFIGHGNLKGPEAKRRVFDMCKLLGWNPKNRDESDAMAVWNHACLTVKPRDAPVITPMMQHKVAVTIGGIEIDDPDTVFKKRASK